MITEKQTTHYKYIFELEEKRYTELLNRGKLYITTIIFYLGLFFFKVTDENMIKTFNEIQTINKNTTTLIFVTTTLLFLSLLFSVLSIGIFTYERVTDLEKLLKSKTNDDESNESFFEDRAIDFAVATKRNSLVNNKKAILLFIASILMLFGIIGHFIFFLTFI